MNGHVEGQRVAVAAACEGFSKIRVPKCSKSNQIYRIQILGCPCQKWSIELQATRISAVSTFTLLVNICCRQQNNFFLFVLNMYNKISFFFLF